MGDGLQEVARASSSTVAYPEIIGLDWSPDGEQLLYTTVERWERYPIHVIDADGSDDRLVVESRYGREPRWSPDDRHIVLAGNTVVSLIDLEDSHARTLLWDFDDPAHRLQLDWIIAD
jgi:Tol biopolymer transport system component